MPSRKAVIRALQPVPFTDGFRFEIESGPVSRARWGEIERELLSLKEALESSGRYARAMDAGIAILTIREGR